jgi:hypothetical protein
MVAPAAASGATSPEVEGRIPSNLEGKMNLKIAIIGGIAYYAAMFIVSFATGYLIHSPEGVLYETYQATASFWRPELNADPPDMGALMPMWIATGLVSSLIAAGIYSVVRSSLAGAAWQRGLKFGVIAGLFAVINAIGYRGVFNLPDVIWTWWITDAVILHLAGGIVLGIVAQKIAPAQA